MHILLLPVIFLASVQTAKIELPTSELDNKIINILEKYRQTLADGKWILPPLDPLVIPPFNVSYAKDSANVTAESKRMKTTGVTSYEINEVRTNVNGDFYIDISEPYLHIEGEYKSSGQLTDKLPIQGEGSYKCDVYNMTVIVNGKLHERENGSLYLQNLHFNVHVDKIKFTIKGLASGPIYDALISALVSDFAPIFINSNIPLFDKFISDAVKFILSPILNQCTADEILDFINTHG